MAQSSVFTAILWSVVLELPLIIVCLAALIVVAGERYRLGRAAVPALYGFGLALFNCIVLHNLGYVVQMRFVDSSPQSIVPILRICGLIGSISWAAVVSLLLLAILRGTGRESGSFSSP